MTSFLMKAPQAPECSTQLQTSLNEKDLQPENIEKLVSSDRESVDDSEYESIQSEESEYVFPESSDTEEEQPVTRILRDRRNLKRPDRYNSLEFERSSVNKNKNSVMVGAINDIKIFDALKDEKWKQAMSEEYDLLMEMKTWELVKMPEGVKPLTNRWVLRQKENGMCKARLVARGFEQRQGIDFSETFSPVARHNSIRLILSIAASRKMKLMTFDVKTAFLHGDLKEEIFMYQPEGFNDNSERICKLKKSLYDLKQAPKN